MLTKITSYLIALAIKWHLIAHGRLCAAANKQAEQAKRASKRAAEVAKAAVTARQQAVYAELDAIGKREDVHQTAAAERAKYGY